MAAPTEKQKQVMEEAAFSENAIKILKLQAEGLSTAEIAGELGLKIENVKGARVYSDDIYERIGQS